MNKREHLLACLAEECSEIQKCACKTLRFGENDHYPDCKNTNIEELAYELDDLIGVVQLLEEEGVIPKWGNNQRIEDKKNKVKKYMEYAKQSGALIDNS